MGEDLLSNLVLFMSALLGALVVVLVTLRVVVRRATETWARDHWEQHTREILEVEHVALEVVAEEAAEKAKDNDNDNNAKDGEGGISPKEQLMAEPVSKGPPGEDPTERRKRERRERAARIRERIRQRRIGERLMADGPPEAPATYGGRPASIDGGGVPSAATLPGPPRKRSRGASAWGAMASSSPGAPKKAPKASVQGVGIPGTGPVPEAARNLAKPDPAPQPADPTGPAAAPKPKPEPKRKAGGWAPAPQPAEAAEASVAEAPRKKTVAPAAPTSAPTPKKRSKASQQKKKVYKTPPDPSTLPAELIDSIKALHAEGRTILANKHYRQATGTSFRDAEKQVKQIIGL